MGRWIGQWRDRRREPRLSLVGDSSRVIAAWRAVESLELDGKLFSDELASTLAGHKAFSNALAAAEPMEGGARGPPGHRLYKISQIAARSWWFDREIMTALTSPAVPGSKGWLSARLTNSARGPSAPPRQVVVLGAGMDSRPWRLPLPPGVVWFEVDRAEVLEAKRRALSLASGEVPGTKTGPVAQYPLRCMRWNGIAADVTDDSLVTKLEAEGFNPGQPTVWVLEGLLMYLEPEAAGRLLKLTASASAPGSTLIAHNITNDFLGRLMTPGQSVPEGTFFPPALVSTWKSGMDADPSVALAAAEWTQQSVCSRAAIAAQITGGDPVGKCAFETTQGFGSDKHVLFFVAKKAQQ